MCRLICRRVVALALAYVLALAPVLPTFAFAVELSSAAFGELCGTTQSGVSETSNRFPQGHGTACPSGTTCPMSGCSGAGLPALFPTAVTAALVCSTAVWFEPVDSGLLPRAGSTRMARAPPQA